MEASLRPKMSLLVAAFQCLLTAFVPDKVSLGLWDLQRLPVKLTGPEQFGKSVWEIDLLTGDKWLGSSKCSFFMRLLDMCVKLISGPDAMLF